MRKLDLWKPWDVENAAQAVVQQADMMMHESFGIAERAQEFRRKMAERAAERGQGSSET